MDDTVELVGVEALVDVLANDQDADGDLLTVRVQSPPANGRLIDHGDGSFRYQVFARRVSGTTASFSYEIDDGRGGTATAFVTIASERVDFSPFALDDRVTTEPATAITIPVSQLLGNDLGTGLAFELVTVPTIGSFSATPDSSKEQRDIGGTVLGRWDYTPQIDPPQGLPVNMCTPGRERRTIVTDPLGHQTEHFFSAFLIGKDDEGENWSASDYSLPFTRNSRSPRLAAPSQGPALSLVRDPRRQWPAAALDLRALSPQSTGRERRGAAQRLPGAGARLFRYQSPRDRPTHRLSRRRRPRLGPAADGLRWLRQLPRNHHLGHFRRRPATLGTNRVHDSDGFEPGAHRTVTTVASPPSAEILFQGNIVDMSKSAVETVERTTRKAIDKFQDIVVGLAKSRTRVPDHRDDDPPD